MAHTLHISIGIVIIDRISSLGALAIAAQQSTRQ
jgi:hypothetical protein